MNEQNPKVKSLYKAMKLIDCFNLHNPEYGIGELAELTGLPRSSVHNIMSTFALLGYIAQNEKNSRYRLGYKFLERGYTTRKTNFFYDKLHPFMEEAACLTGESITYAILDGIESIYIETAYPPLTASVRLNIGARYPLYSTAGGKSILAFSPERVFNQVCENEMIALTDTTITSVSELEEEIKNIRHRGYAIDNMENEYGVRGLAIPLWNNNGEFMGALSLSGPAHRITDELISGLVNILLEVQRKIKALQ